MKELKISKIEKLTEKFELYDIETKNHNFYANDILVHNSNGAVCYSNPDGFWVQSRKNIITPKKDNAGCAFAQMANEKAWMEIIDDLADEYNIDLNENIISVYFEWCGGNIQKNACVSGLDKMAIIFRHFKVSPIEPQTAEDGEETAAKWYETKLTVDEEESHETGDSYYEWVSNKDKNIFNVMNFPTISLEIDFSRPDLAQNELIKLTEEVEKHSGIGLELYNKEFGGQFEIKDGKFSKNFPQDVKEKLNGLEDGEYSLSF